MAGRGGRRRSLGERLGPEGVAAVLCVPVVALFIALVLTLGLSH
jgi:hypothetical protein